MCYHDGCLKLQLDIWHIWHFHRTLFSHCILSFLDLFIGKTEQHIYRERKRDFSIPWFTLQMASVAKNGPEQSQDPGTPFCPPFCPPFCRGPGSCMGTGVSKNQTSISVWAASVTSSSSVACRTTALSHCHIAFNYYKTKRRSCEV